MIKFIQYIKVGLYTEIVFFMFWAPFKCFIYINSFIITTLQGK